MLNNYIYNVGLNGTEPPLTSLFHFTLVTRVDTEIINYLSLSLAISLSWSIFNYPFRYVWVKVKISAPALPIWLCWTLPVRTSRLSTTE